MNWNTALCCAVRNLSEGFNNSYLAGILDAYHLWGMQNNTLFLGFTWKGIYCYHQKMHDVIFPNIKSYNVSFFSENNV